MSTNYVPTRFVRYASGVEQIAPDETESTEKIVAAMRAISERMGARYRHAVRSVHSKSHGVIAGTLEIAGGMAEPYQQGIFAGPGRYDVVARLSTNPGDLLADDVSTPRGFALKILGPEGGEMVDGHAGERTQDLLMVNGPVLGAPGPKEFAAQIELLKNHLCDPEEVKEGVSLGARTLETIFKAFGKPSTQIESLGGAAATHLLGETFNTQAPSRYGDYVAKFSIAPSSDNVKALTGKKIDIAHDRDAIKDAVSDFFASERAVYDFRVQLCTDLEKMPVENLAIAWDEEESPFVTIGKLTFEPQASYAPERRVYGDDFLSFNPWHAFEAHRPLGAINRARRVAYPMSSTYRSTENVRPHREPRSAGEFFVVDAAASPAT